MFPTIWHSENFSVYIALCFYCHQGCTKWPPFGKRRLEMHLLWWKYVKIYAVTDRRLFGANRLLALSLIVTCIIVDRNLHYRWSLLALSLTPCDITNPTWIIDGTMHYTKVYFIWSWHRPMFLFCVLHFRTGSAYLWTFTHIVSTLVIGLLRNGRNYK